MSSCIVCDVFAREMLSEWYIVTTEIDGFTLLAWAMSAKDLWDEWSNTLTTVSCIRKKNGWESHQTRTKKVDLRFHF